MWGPEHVSGEREIFVELVFSFHFYMVSRDRTQVSRFVQVSLPIKVILLGGGLLHSFLFSSLVNNTKTSEFINKVQS